MRPACLEYITTNARRLGRVPESGTESDSCVGRDVRSSRRRSFPMSASPQRCWRVRGRLPGIDNPVSLGGAQEMSIGAPVAGRRAVLRARGRGDQAWSRRSRRAPTRARIGRMAHYSQNLPERLISGYLRFRLAEGNPSSRDLAVTPRSTESLPTRGALLRSGRSRTSWRSVRSSRRARPPIAPPSRSPRSVPGTAGRSS